LRGFCPDLIDRLRRLTRCIVTNQLVEFFQLIIECVIEMGAIHSSNRITLAHRWPYPAMLQHKLQLARQPGQ